MTSYDDGLPTMDTLRTLIESARTNLGEISHCLVDAVDLEQSGRTDLEDCVRPVRYYLEALAVRACAMDLGVIPGALRGKTTEGVAF